MKLSLEILVRKSVIDEKGPWLEIGARMLEERLLGTGVRGVVWADVLASEESCKVVLGKNRDSVRNVVELI